MRGNIQIGEFLRLFGHVRRKREEYVDTNSLTSNVPVNLLFRFLLHFVFETLDLDESLRI